MGHKVQSKQDIITDIFLEEGILHFSGKLSTGTDPAINFDLIKWITKYIYIYLNYNGKMEGGRSLKR